MNRRTRSPLVAVFLLLTAAPAAAAPIAIHAHRGGTVTNGRPDFAEETLATYTNAASDGFVLEVDAKLTKDGVPVAIHDATLDRTTTCSGEVRSYTLAALRACKPDLLGSPGSPLRTRRVRPSESIATIAQVLKLARETGATVNLEIKNLPTDPDYDPTPAYANRVMDVVLASHIPRAQLIVQSFIPANLDVAKRRLRGVATSLLTLGSSTDAIDAARTSGYAWISPQWPLPAGYVTRAHSLGRRVVPFTLDKAAEVRAAGRAGVDALITDDPFMAARALGFHSFHALFAHVRDVPHGLRVHGGFVRPRGLSKRQACNGFVTVRLVSRTRTVATSRVRLSRRCEFDAALHVRRGAPRRLRMSIRFEGNAAVLPHVLGPLGFAR
jgi:glycerophosphoryl diester phosphodiesterase